MPVSSSCLVDSPISEHHHHQRQVEGDCAAILVNTIVKNITKTKENNQRQVEGDPAAKLVNTNPWY